MTSSHAVLLATLFILTLSTVSCSPVRGERGNSDDDDSGGALDDDDTSIFDDDDDTTPPADDDDTTPPADDDDTTPPADDDDTTPPADDDDTMPPADDDDSVVTTGTFPATGDAPCGGGSGAADVYLVTLSGEVQITVDTTSAAATFDPYAYLTTDTTSLAASGAIAAGDDEVPCTFPPPSYGCPQFDANYVGQAALVIYGFVDNCNSSGMGGYEVTLTGAGAPSNYDQLLDDYPL